MRNTLNSFKSTPRKLFLIDGTGAILSMFLLGVVLVNLEPDFGTPKPSLYFLASFPLLFAVYDFYCYFKVERRLGMCLVLIAISNLIYCVLSIGIAFYHLNEITLLGWFYIVFEILILILLSYLELKTARKVIDK